MIPKRGMCKKLKISVEAIINRLRAGNGSPYIRSM